MNLPLGVGIEGRDVDLSGKLQKFSSLDIIVNKHESTVQLSISKDDELSS